VADGDTDEGIDDGIEDLADELVTDGWRSRWPPMSY
jgi:hypothetical protein